MVHIDTAHPVRRKFLIMMIVLTMVEALSSLEQTMIFAALPRVAREEGLITSGWLITIFLLVQASTAAIGARLGDLYGRRRVLLVLIGLCLVGSLVSAVAENFYLVIAGRALQGASGAILALCYAIAKKHASPEAAPFWVGILTGGYAVASAAGYLLGGYLADIGSWRDIFWLSTGYAALLLFLVPVAVPSDPVRQSQGRTDILGGILFVPAIAAILYGLTRGAKAGWLQPETVGFIAFGAALSVFWAVYEYRHKEPLINVRLFGQANIRLGNICSSLASISVMQLPLIFMTLLQQPPETGAGLGLTATMAGLLKLPSNLLAFFAAALGGYICAKRGGSMGILAGGVMAVLFWTVLIFVRDDLWLTFVCLLGCAFASTILLAAIPNLLLEDAPENRSGEVVGLLSTTRGIFTAIGAQIIVLILASSQTTGPGGALYPTASAYLVTISFIVLCSAAIAVFSVRSALRNSNRAGVPGR